MYISFYILVDEHSKLFVYIVFTVVESYLRLQVFLLQKLKNEII